MNKFMTKLEMKTRIHEIREELENRYKTGIVKMANDDGTIISTEILQNEMFSLTCRLSKFE